MRCGSTSSRTSEMVVFVHSYKKKYSNFNKDKSLKKIKDVCDGLAISNVVTYFK